jgi:alkylation response protein AidB-like acyl-CoA dehydrogenase
MDLDFTEEQEMLREMVRGVCTEFSSLETVREVEDDPGGYPAEFWKQLSELGLLGLTLPEEYGGAEQTILDAAIVYEEFGRSLAPSPHFVSSILAGHTLVKARSDAQKQEWLPKIIAGEAVLTPAWLEPDNSYGPTGVQLEAKAEGDGFTISGTKRHVFFADAATRLVVLARTGRGAEDIDLFLVDPKAEGVKLTQQKSLASDTQYRVDLDHVKLSQADRIGGAQSGWSTWSAVMHEGIILQAALAIGGAQKALEMTVEFAKERQQFGKPLAAFQALSHYMADASTNIDGGRVLVWEAAWAASEGKPISRLAPMAKLFACQTYRDATATFEQIWGGVGFTIEYDIQLFFRRAKQLQLSWFDTRTLEELVASDVLDN